METWQSLILGLCGIGFIGDIILHFVLPSRRRKDNAESEHAQHDADRAEVERLHMMIDHQQKSLDKYLDIEKDLSERISEQNKALNEKEEQIRDKTDQIRKLTEQILASEHGRNADKDEITRLTAECGRLRMLVAHFKRWHCQFADCLNRIPPNAELRGQSYAPPDIELKSSEQISVAVNAK
nr:MAG TPA: hypothetical protein [Caudoviricetes sp.]